jgi:hypothetical protein
MKSLAALTIEVSQHVLTLLHKSLPLPLPPRREGTRYLSLIIPYSCAAELVDGLHLGYTGCRHKTLAWTQEHAFLCIQARRKAFKEKHRVQEISIFAC